MLDVARAARNGETTTAPASSSRGPSSFRSAIRPKASHYCVISRMMGLSATETATLLPETTELPVALTIGWYFEIERGCVVKFTVTGTAALLISDFADVL